MRLSIKVLDGKRYWELTDNLEYCKVRENETSFRMVIRIDISHHLFHCENKKEAVTWAP